MCQAFNSAVISPDPGMMKMEVAVSRRRQAGPDDRLPADPPPQRQGSPAFSGKGAEVVPDWPHVINTDKNPAYGEALRQLSGMIRMPRSSNTVR